MRYGRIHRKRRPQQMGVVARFSLMLFLLPLALAACGDEAAAPTATTGAPAATTAATRPAATAGATAAATTAPMTAAGTAAPAATTGAPAATTGAAAAGTSAPAAANAGFGTPLTTKRGEGGTLRLLWWQAPTILNMHTNNGTKDQDASSVVTEPLARVSTSALVPDIPILAASIPSAANGLLAADGTSVTWKLKEGVTWSDGMPFTADDVVFTYQYITDPKTGSTSTTNYTDVQDVVAVDKTTVKVTFKAPTAAWFFPFVGDAGEIFPKHVVSLCMDAKACEFNQKPTGTGAYVVQEFRPGDSVIYKANEKFREANAPFFATVELKGGGDATTAAKAVQTGQVDYAWNLQVTPDILKQLQDSGKTVATVPGYSTEQIRLNYADPRKEVDGELSSPNSKNPFFSDPKVVEAFKYAIDRKSIATQLYGPGGADGNTIISLVRGDVGKPYIFDLKKSEALLEEAGWKKGADGIREKGGVKMNLTFRTSVTSVRDRTSLIIQQSLKQIGIGMELKPVDASVYFGRPDNPDALSRFTVDFEMYSTGSSRPDPQSFLEEWTTASFATKANNWGKSNVMKWSNAQYDALYKQLVAELNPEKRKALALQMDEIIVEQGGSIPIVVRKDVFGHRPDLINNQHSPYSSQLWNIAHWALKK